MRIDEAFTPEQRAVAVRLRDADREERAQGIREPGSLMALAQEVAELLFQLVLTSGARKIVELGTSHGYSTLHLAAAAARTDGRVLTLERYAEKTAMARGNMEAAGLRARVDFVTGELADLVPELPDAIDFVLVDVPYAGVLELLPALLPKLAPGALVFVDGGPPGTWAREPGLGLRRYFEEDPAFSVSILPMGKEQLLAVRLP